MFSNQLIMYWFTSLVSYQLCFNQKRIQLCHVWALLSHENYSDLILVTLITTRATKCRINHDNNIFPLTGKPPEWSDNLKKYEKKEVPYTDDLTQDIKFLLMPATPAEEEQVLLYLEPKDESSKKYIKTSIGNIPLYIGKYGKNPVIVVMTAPAKDRQGPTQAAIIATTILNKIESIEYVIAVGVCFGIDKKKQDLGDVVISSIICDFTSKREGTTVHLRGTQDRVGHKILNIFRLPHNFKMPHNNNVRTGPVISTPNLIDNATVKASLVKERPDAVGGEMEGAAINAAVKKNPPATCIVIKGIGDWADGTKEGSKEWKPYAARAAAYYVKTALNEFSYSK